MAESERDPRDRIRTVTWFEKHRRTPRPPYPQTPEHSSMPSEQIEDIPSDPPESSKKFVRLINNPIYSKIKALEQWARGDVVFLLSQNITEALRRLNFDRILTTPSDQIYTRWTTLDYTIHPYQSKSEISKVILHRYHIQLRKGYNQKGDLITRIEAEFTEENNENKLATLFVGTKRRDNREVKKKQPNEKSMEELSTLIDIKTLFREYDLANLRAIKIPITTFKERYIRELEFYLKGKSLPFQKRIFRLDPEIEDMDSPNSPQQEMIRFIMAVFAFTPTRLTQG